MIYSDFFPNDLFINREGGVEPEIAEGITINGLIDCIHKVTIEKGVFFGHSVALLTGGHSPYVFGEERKHSSGGGPIYIEEGVWIASFAIIIGPADIGKHSVIGAGTVVRGNVPAYEVWIGNPAFKIKEIPHD